MIRSNRAHWSELSPRAVAHDGTTVIPASYNTNRTVEIGDKHQGHTAKPVEVVVRPVTT